MYFNADYLPEGEAEYVLWIDVMGIQNSMAVSLKTSANYIAKLHLALLENMADSMTIYPVMDGAYVTTTEAETMRSFINGVIPLLAKEFISEEVVGHRFMVRGGLAYGPVIHGKDIPKECNNIITDNSDYMGSLLLGLPVIRANQAEKKAPPFGIFCDETVRIQGKAFSYIWYNWWGNEKEEMKQVLQLRGSVEEYFGYYEKRFHRYDYSVESIKRHKEMCQHYFADLEEDSTDV